MLFAYTTLFFYFRIKNYINKRKEGEEEEKFIIIDLFSVNYME